MKNLILFADEILKNNSVETMVQVFCSLTDEEIEKIIAGWEMKIVSGLTASVAEPRNFSAGTIHANKDIW